MHQLLESARAMKDELIQYRRDIHQNPEVGDHLPLTAKYVMDRLKQFGYEPKEICESGIVALVGKPNSKKTFLLRADMDALPIEEQTDYSFKATNGKMHACGHDFHTAMLLGAAKLLKQYENELEGTVKLVFQPNEEGFKGAKLMLKSGVLENPKVDAAMALHVHSGTPTNTILCGLGTSIAGCTIFRIIVNGVGCHGAMPETGVDPINIATHIYSSMQEIITKEIAATKSAVITVGKFHAGNTHNVIPEQAVLEGTIRYLDVDIGDFIYKRLEEIVVTTAKMFRGKASIEIVASVPPLTNDRDLANNLTSYVKEVVGEQSVISFEGGGMGSEDFASYCYEVPSVYFLLGAGTKEEDKRYGFPMHHPQVVFNEEILPTGAAIHAYAAMQWLKSNH
ncbi:M20 metallopeptidase family protein [Bacillus massiliigorillae]|uniref:M20 metallopeptidase family protein n=1 Tax=Bacillus massiliigorillae TaxID=1243664 RepID=UPI0003A6986E|nr:M20 family metallopeptidase [Bacillus massiliigorillae]